jgi:hypothetical protein
MKDMWSLKKLAYLDETFHEIFTIWKLPQDGKSSGRILPVSVNNCSKLLWIFIFYFLFSCSNSLEKNEKSVKAKTALQIERELYSKFLRNLEKTLWTSPHFFRKKDPLEGGWRIVDVTGKFIIQSTHNFTENPDTSLTSYELKIIELDNPLTNQHAKDFTLPIQVEMRNGRTDIIPLEFYYEPKTTFSYRERIFYFPFAEGIIVNYRTVDNDEFHLTWEADRIVQETNEHIELEITKKLLWKKVK